jgi:hypothetical protein
MKPKQIPHFTEPLWATMVDYRLSLGYGVEDIALQLKCPVDVVRLRVRSLRGQGKLAAIYSKMRARMVQS